MASEKDYRPLPSAGRHRTHLIGFRTALPRLGDADSLNNSFWMRATIPEKPNWDGAGKLESVFIMINGLAESDVSPYDEFAAALAAVTLGGEYNFATLHIRERMYTGR